MTEPERRTPSRMRRAIAKSMSASALVPQFTIESEPRLAALDRAVAQLRSGGSEFSYTDVFVAASARALREHPELNSSFAEGDILEHAVVNIGLAVALEDGLIAPAIRDADMLTLTALAAERGRLAAAARGGTLTPEDVFSATFTISNLGAFGVRRFRALVVPPQSAILALGTITGERTVSLSLSCDHRVLDGAEAAKFLVAVVASLEEPDWIPDRVR